MLRYRHYLMTVILIIFMGGSLALAENLPLFNMKIDKSICYGKLYDIKKLPESLVISVDNHEFTITKETPLLFDRAHDLLDKKVQVIYKTSNNIVINLFGDHRQDPR